MNIIFSGLEFMHIEMLFVWPQKNRPQEEKNYKVHVKQTSCETEVVEERLNWLETDFGHKSTHEKWKGIRKWKWAWVYATLYCVDIDEDRNNHNSGKGSGNGKNNSDCNLHISMIEFMPLFRFWLFVSHSKSLLPIMETKRNETKT